MINATYTPIKREAILELITRTQACPDSRTILLRALKRMVKVWNDEEFLKETRKATGLDLLHASGDNFLIRYKVFTS